MNKNDRRYLSTLIKEATGVDMKVFVVKIIGDSYHNFMHRLRRGRILISDYLVIKEATGLSLDDIIAYDPRYQDELRRAKDIAINFKELVDQEPIAPESVTPPDSVEDTEEVSNSFRFEDI